VSARPDPEHGRVREEEKKGPTELGEEKEKKKERAGGIYVYFVIRKRKKKEKGMTVPLRPLGRK